MLFNKKQNTDSAYEKMMEQLMNDSVGAELIEQALRPGAEDKSAYPMRYRIIALGFLKKYDLTDLNDELLNHGCQPLYPRSSFEATLAYAFSHQLSYKQWREILLICYQVEEQWQQTAAYAERKEYFKNKQITFGELEDYVLANSEKNDDKELVTMKITYVMERLIVDTSEDIDKFIQFYTANLYKFSDVREKTRYYFCKYLYYHILTKIQRYQSEVADNVPSREQLMDLMPLKAESKLRRRKMDSDKLFYVLRSCPISPAAIFEEFNYYYFEYVSLDWVDLMLENASDISDLMPSQITMVASFMRENASKKDREKLKDMSDSQVVADRIQYLQSDQEEPLTSRKGENAIRKYLRGDVDIDRTTLICFLLFWGTGQDDRNDIRITEERINEILDECGFAMLRKKEAFDHFVIHYIHSKDPVSYLMEEMDRYMRRGESFFVHEVYAKSKSNAKEIRKSMLT